MTQKQRVRVGLVGEQWEMNCRSCGWTYRAAWPGPVFDELSAHLTTHRADTQPDYRAALVDIVDEFKSFAAQTKQDTEFAQGFHTAAEVGLEVITVLLQRHGVTDISTT